MLKHTCDWEVVGMKREKTKGCLVILESFKKDNSDLVDIYLQKELSEDINKKKPDLISISLKGKRLFVFLFLILLKLKYKQK